MTKTKVDIPEFTRAKCVISEIALHAPELLVIAISVVVAVVLGSAWWLIPAGVALAYGLDQERRWRREGWRWLRPDDVPTVAATSDDEDASVAAVPLADVAPARSFTVDSAASEDLDDLAGQGVDR